MNEFQNMKVVCIRSYETPLLSGEVRYSPKSTSMYFGRNYSNSYKPLVVGEIYEVEDDNEIDYPLYYFINGHFENKTDFIELSEYRKIKLESIGI